MSMSGDPEMEEIARALMWWQAPQITLAKPGRFLVQVMTLGTWKEIVKVRERFGSDSFRDALLNAPPGVFDNRSWAYWRKVLKLPPDDLPARSLK